MPNGQTAMTIGIDLGDQWSRFAVLDAAGELVEEGRVRTTRAALKQRFTQEGTAVVVLEVGPQSGWVSTLFNELGYAVLVANPREVKAVTGSTRKSDREDARVLARLARVDPGLLHPVRHRSEEARAGLLAVRSRAALVEARTQLINCARGLAKTLGVRVPACGTANFAARARTALPPALCATLSGLLVAVEALTHEILAYDENLECMADQLYPETQPLREVPGVGVLTALVYVLTIDEPHRFTKSRDVGCYLGLRPKRRQSGGFDPQLGITKAGDTYLRKLLVQCAHHILGHFGPDTALRRWGLKLCERGGGNAKKRAVVAVARKLAVLMHHLWVTGERYSAFPPSNAIAA
jgi:transposase